MAAGEPFGVTPYGTEAMHLLRAEKGFVIVGQDTDGTVTPGDLGMSWIVRKDDSDFVGRRSLSRPDTVRPDRKQLVGLLPGRSRRLAARRRADRGSRVGGHGAAGADAGPRHVELPQPHAGPDVRAGHGGRRTRPGRAPRSCAPLPGGDIEAEVTAPVFYDERNERRDGGGA